jgi:hypothetical protein
VNIQISGSSGVMKRENSRESAKEKKYEKRKERKNLKYFDCLIKPTSLQLCECFVNEMKIYNFLA